MAQKPVRWAQWLPFFIYGSILLWRVPGLEYYLDSSDHGVQLSLGKQVLFGKTPNIDLVSAAGPLATFIPALGLWASDSLIGESIICSVGHAVCLWIIYVLARQYVSTLPAWLASLVAFSLLARFYKWWYCLFPLLALYCLRGFLNADAHKRARWIFSAGIAGGIGGLYRLDIGLVSLCFYTFVLFVLLAQLSNFKERLGLFGQYLAGWMIPLGVWLLILGLQGGLQACYDYPLSFYEGVTGSVVRMSLPMPRFNLSDPFSSVSGTGLAFKMVPLTCALCVLYGLWMRMFRPAEEPGKYTFLAATGVMGLGLYPQSLHRSDAHHLLQVLPPMIIGGCLLLSQLWTSTMRYQKRHLLLGGLALVLLSMYIAALLLSGWGVSYARAGRIDLAPWSSNPIARYQLLARGIHAGIDHPVARLILEIQSRTTPTDSVLVVSGGPQLNYLSDRRMSGCYIFFGVSSSDTWRRRNLAAVKQDPPELVVIAPAALVAPSGGFKDSFPELSAFLFSYLTRVVYQGNGLVIVAR